MELALDKVPLRVEVLFLATVLGVLALFVLAVRAAAERMAEMLGEKPGETIGYLTRLDSKRSAKTRVLVVTGLSISGFKSRISKMRSAAASPFWRRCTTAPRARVSGLVALGIPTF